MCIRDRLQVESVHISVHPLPNPLKNNRSKELYRPNDIQRPNDRPSDIFHHVKLFFYPLSLHFNIIFLWRNQGRYRDRPCKQRSGDSRHELPWPPHFGARLLTLRVLFYPGSSLTPVPLGHYRCYQNLSYNSQKAVFFAAYCFFKKSQPVVFNFIQVCSLQIFTWRMLCQQS